MLYDTATIVAFCLSVLIPAAASLLSRQHWPSEVTAGLTIALSALTGLLTEATNAGDGYDWKKGVLTAVGSWIIAAIARKQLWEGTATDAKLLAVGSK